MYLDSSDNNRKHWTYSADPAAFVKQETVPNWQLQNIEHEQASVYHNGGKYLAVENTNVEDVMVGTD